MNWIFWVIVLCEIGFWILLVAGLAARYLLRMEKLGFALLAATPLVDLILLIVTGFDLSRGATATTAHALAAVYIGVSLAFGKSMIRWADERFQYYVLKSGNKPQKRFGTEHAVHYMKGWFRHAAAFAVGAALLLGTAAWIGVPERTEALIGVARIWAVVVAIDLLISVSYFIWPKRPPAG